MNAIGLRHFVILATSLLLYGCGGGGGSGGQPPVINVPPPPDPGFVALQSDPGDFIGAGLDYRYTQADAQIVVTTSGRLLSIRIDGNENWSGDFELPDTFTRLEVGVYSNLTRYPFHDVAVGGLSWSGEGRGCNQLTGSFEITSVTYDGTALTEIRINFEQYCEGGSVALRGEIHWYADDETAPPGPQSSVPPGLWEPASGATPDTGNYIYLDSDAGDYIGAGNTYLYTPADAQITVSTSNGRLSVSINGNENWNGDFQAMSSIDTLEVGYYGELQRYPFHNPVKGGLSWSGEGRGCNRLTGWFVIDSIAFNGSALESIDLRFEQHCEGGGPALHGEIHWDVNDTTAAPGPVNPPPTGLWEPTVGATPPTGDYIYLESEQGDWIGQGQNYLYADVAEFVLTSSGARLDVSVNGSEFWNATFLGMDVLSRLEVGYYGDLQRYPFHNPVKGGLSWTGEGRGCNTLEGWFVVDSVTYDGSTLMAIELRFEQRCEGGTPALHGEIRWSQ